MNYWRHLRAPLKRRSKNSLTQSFLLSARVAYRLELVRLIKHAYLFHVSGGLIRNPYLLGDWLEGVLLEGSVKTVKGRQKNLGFIITASNGCIVFADCQKVLSNAWFMSHPHHLPQISIHFLIFILLLKGRLDYNRFSLRRLNLYSLRCLFLSFGLESPCLNSECCSLGLRCKL